MAVGAGDEGMPLRTTEPASVRRRQMRHAMFCFSRNPSSRLRRSQRILSFEQLDRRELLAALVVNSNSDRSLDEVADGEVTLRSAIEQINQLQEAENTISFELPEDASRIAPASALPSIEVPVVLDGALTGDAAHSMIELNGAAVSAASPLPVNGLVFAVGSEFSVVRRMVINRFSAAGVVLDGNNITVDACWIGLDASGRIEESADPPGNLFGVLVNGADQLLGGDSPAQGNVIAANVRHGVWLRSSTGGTTLRNNWIGVDATGGGKAGNGEFGVFVDASPDNQIVSNIVGANGQTGVQVEFSGGGANTVADNWIGVNPTGAELGNGGEGVRIASGGQQNLVRDNTIENNQGAGVSVRSTPQGNFSFNNTLLGNRIVHNQQDGVLIEGANATRVEENTIEANGRNGITVVQLVDPFDGPTGRNLLTHNAISGNVGYRPDGSAETLAVNVAGTAIVAQYDPQNGALTLTGPDSVANYEQVLRTLTYDNSAASPDLTPRTVHVTVNDGEDVSAAAVSLVTLVGPRPWMNPDDPANIDGAGAANVTDLIVLVQFLRDRGPDAPPDLPPVSEDFQPPPYYDPNGDGKATIADVVQVVTLLRERLAAGLLTTASQPGEGEIDNIQEEFWPWSRRNSASD